MSARERPVDQDVIRASPFKLSWLRPSYGQMEVVLTPAQYEAWRGFARWMRDDRRRLSEYALTVNEKPDGFDDALRRARAAQGAEAAENASGMRRERTKPTGRSRGLGFGTFRSGD